MKPILKFALLVTCLIAPTTARSEQNSDSNFFVRALRQGVSTSVIPPELRSVIDEIRTGSEAQGDYVIEAKLLFRFKQQPRCGRVAFVLTHPASQTYWPQYGGQLNICEDGLAPWQACQGEKGLVPPGSKCKDGKPASNTQEVEEAVLAAANNGSIPFQQVTEQLKAK